MSSTEGKAEGRFTVARELGLHARPAGQFVSIASRYTCEIEVCREGDSEWVSGSSVLSILSLAATRGTALSVRAVGEGAAEAVAELGELIQAEAD